MYCIRAQLIQHLCVRSHGGANVLRSLILVQHYLCIMPKCMGLSVHKTRHIFSSHLIDYTKCKKFGLYGKSGMPKSNGFVSQELVIRFSGTNFS